VQPLGDRYASSRSTPIAQRCHSCSMIAGGPLNVSGAMQAGSNAATDRHRADEV